MAQQHAPTELLFKEVRTGNLLQVRRAVEDGAALQILDAWGWAPVHYAVHHGHFEVVEYLLDCGLNVNIFDKYQWTPLHRAVHRKEIKIIKLLLERGVDKDLKTIYGETARDLAKGDERIIKLLGGEPVITWVLLALFLLLLLKSVLK